MQDARALELLGSKVSGGRVDRDLLVVKDKIKK